MTRCGGGNIVLIVYSITQPPPLNVLSRRRRCITTLQVETNHYCDSKSFYGLAAITERQNCLCASYREYPRSSSSTGRRHNSRRTHVKLHGHAFGKSRWKQNFYLTRLVFPLHLLHLVLHQLIIIKSSTVKPMSYAKWMLRFFFPSTCQPFVVVDELRLYSAAFSKIPTIKQN
ncbi:hypothetical protein BZA77DRAFT_168386 [Pyronema omphalodes]|nr:hypothetical protein BZA77DRAFT_168386 [Pyronema omphalodes]